ncbi:hypothetical protein, partial [uncultured Duncaniella sp.]|uniref:hypothetical protein n=1 Tax=uncultured Duncaniella sp. TaxID=2768039 RepID=UPI00272B12FF
KEISNESLIMMCDSFISDTKPYLFCDIDEVRDAYIDCERFLNKVDKSIDLTNCISQMKSFSIESGDKFAKLVKGVSGLSNLPKFVLSKDVISGLSKLVTTAGIYFETKSNFPHIQNCEEWIISRANNLEKQMNI